jgi:hypothetical protein
VKHEMNVTPLARSAAIQILACLLAEEDFDLVHRRRHYLLRLQCPNLPGSASISDGFGFLASFYLPKRR